MPGPEFHQTGYGRRFFESQLPDLIKGLNRVADSLESKEPEDLWLNDEVQFARLLCEIRAAGFLELDPLMCADMIASMDTDTQSVEEIFKRAEVLFEKTKRSIGA